MTQTLHRSSPGRIHGLDVARGLAVIGMVLVNYKVVMGAGDSGPTWLNTIVGSLEGRAAALFVVLAGAGVSLLSRRAREAKDRDLLKRHRATLFRRALFLFVVGLAYTPIWPADILHFYGVYIVFAAFLLAAPERRLWLMSLLITIGFVVLLLVLDYERGWDFDSLTYSGFWTARGMIRHLFFNGFHPVIPWLAFLLVGMAVGRMDLTNTAHRRSVLGVSVVTAVLAEVVSRVLTGMVQARVADPEVALLLGTAPMPPMPLYIVAGSGTAVAVICLCIVIADTGTTHRWLRPLIHAGQLALTLYVAHVVIGMGLLEALGMLEDQTLVFSVLAALIFSLSGITFAHLWRLRYSRGPLEAVMRKLTDPT